MHVYSGWCSLSLWRSLYTFFVLPRINMGPWLFNIIASYFDQMQRLRIINELVANDVIQRVSNWMMFVTQYGCALCWEQTTIIPDFALKHVHFRNNFSHSRKGYLMLPGQQNMVLDQCMDTTDWLSQPATVQILVAMLCSLQGLSGASTSGVSIGTITIYSQSHRYKQVFLSHSVFIFRQPGQAEMKN